MRTDISKMLVKAGKRICLSEVQHMMQVHIQFQRDKEEK